MLNSPKQFSCRWPRVTSGPIEAPPSRRTVAQFSWESNIFLALAFSRVVQPRSTHCRQPHVSDDKIHLIRKIVALSKKPGRHGYRRMTDLLRVKGWKVNHKRDRTPLASVSRMNPDKSAPLRWLWLNSLLACDCGQCTETMFEATTSCSIIRCLR